MHSLPSDPDATLTYDPQLTGQRFVFQQVQHAGKDLKNAPSALIRNSEDDESCVLPRRVDANVGEAGVERDQGALLQLADGRQIRVRTSSQLFIPNGQSIVTVFAEKHGKLRVKVFVGFEAH